MNAPHAATIIGILISSDLPCQRVYQGGRVQLLQDRLAAAAALHGEDGMQKLRDAVQ